MKRRGTTRKTSLRLDEDTDLLLEALREATGQDNVTDLFKLCVRESAQRRGITVASVLEAKKGKKHP